MLKGFKGRTGWAVVRVIPGGVEGAPYPGHAGLDIVFKPRSRWSRFKAWVRGLFRW